MKFAIKLNKIKNSYDGVTFIDAKDKEYFCALTLPDKYTIYAMHNGEIDHHYHYTFDVSAITRMLDNNSLFIKEV